MPSDETLEGVLAEFAAGFPRRSIPESAINHVKLLLIDGIGCALAGDLADETEAVATATRVWGDGTFSVIGRTEGFSPAGATMLNAYLMTAMTVCDVYRPAHCHITPLVIPPALMAAEETGASGEEFLAALAIAMELTVRVAAGLDYAAFRARGWHSPGVVGPFGAVAAIGRLRGFDEVVMRHAFGLAGTQSAGSYLSWGTPAVKFHQARGAVSGVLAAELARQGFPGGRQPLTAADGGVYNTHSNGGRADLALAGLGERWELEQIAIRLWPGASPVQAMLTAIFDLITTQGAGEDNVTAVRIGISPEDFDTHAGFARPSGTFEALLSYSYLCSAALHDRKVWFEQVGHSRYTDPVLLGFADERIRLMAEMGVPLNGCRLEAEFTDGRREVRRVEAARGTPENPADLSDVRAKFHQCADRPLGRESAGSLLELLTDIESCDDVREIWSILRG